MSYLKYIELEHGPHNQSEQPNEPGQCDMCRQRHGHRRPVELERYHQLCDDDGCDEPRLTAKLFTFPDKVNENQKLKRIIN